jgi:3-deoxy-7-phosphoheptulonate synthase
VAGGGRRVFGAMIESHLRPGAQKFTPGRDDPSKLAYGTSITDPCLGWEQTVEALRMLSDAVRRRRG